MSVTPLHLDDSDITTDWRAQEGPTEADDDRDVGGEGDADTGDEEGGGVDQPGGGDLDTSDQ